MTEKDDTPRSKALLLKKAFGLQFFIFLAVVLLFAYAVYYLRGEQTFVETIWANIDTVSRILPNFTGALLIAFFIQSLLPREMLRKLVGEDTGIRGLAIGTVAGAITPSGPMTSFPLLVGLRNAGAGRSALIAYVTAWSTMGIHRILIWEIQLLGLEFALVRVISSAPLGIISGLLSRYFPDLDTTQPQLEEKPAP